MASFQNKDYEQAGAEVVPQKQAFDNDIIFKIRPPKLHEVDQIRQNGTLISFLQPAHNADLIKQLEKRHITSLGMELIPRISRAQVFDALSSMANIAGYKAGKTITFKLIFTNMLSCRSCQPFRTFLWRTNYCCWTSKFFE